MHERSLRIDNHQKMKDMNVRRLFWCYLYGVLAYIVLRFFGVNNMRNHSIICQLEGKKPAKYIQYLINYYAVMYVEKLLMNSGLSKREQIAILDKMLEDIS